MVFGDRRHCAWPVPGYPRPRVMRVRFMDMLVLSIVFITTFSRSIDSHTLQFWSDRSIEGNWDTQWTFRTGLNQIIAPDLPLSNQIKSVINRDGGVLRAESATRQQYEQYSWPIEGPSYMFVQQLPHHLAIS